MLEQINKQIILQKVVPQIISKKGGTLDNSFSRATYLVMRWCLGRGATLGDDVAHGEWSMANHLGDMAPKSGSGSYKCAATWT